MSSARVTCPLVACALLLWSCHGTRPSPAAPEQLPEATSPVDRTEPEIQEPSLDWETLTSTSLRNPNDGTLTGGVALPLVAPGLRFNPSRDPNARYGTTEVVRALLGAGLSVHELHGGLPARINDLSLRGGGPIPRHGSHQSGRDVDVLFYQLGPDGAPIEPVGAFFDPEGNGVDFRDSANPKDDVPLRIDLPRTWTFVRALIEDPEAALQSIYVAEHLRRLLLDHARNDGAPEATWKRFAQMTCQPSYPHDDHFHFRFYCSAEDIALGCRDSHPLHAWRRAELAALGVTSKPLLPKRPMAATVTVSHEEARRAAGTLAPEVEDWLLRRKVWLEKPHPGRPYCP